MKKQLKLPKLISVLLMILLLSCSKQEGVYPSVAGNLDPIELGQAIFMFIPNEGISHIGWSYLSNSKKIFWLDETYKTSTNGELNLRTGLLRINVDGIKSTVLKKEVKELAWSVVYEGAGNPNFGVRKIDLKPGIDDGDANCFGSTTENCTFNPINSMAKEGIKVDILCKSSEATGLNLSAKGKKTIKAKWVTSGGSGGSSSWIELYVNDDPIELCK